MAVTTPTFFPASSNTRPCSICISIYCLIPFILGTFKVNPLSAICSSRRFTAREEEFLTELQVRVETKREEREK